VPTALPNNNVGIEALVLQSGAVAIAYNNMQGQTAHNLRNHLAVSLSEDGGATFPVTRILESHGATATATRGTAAGSATAATATAGAAGAGAGAGDLGLGGLGLGSSLGGVGPTDCDCYSYPTLVQTADGAVHIGFTYQRKTIKVTSVSEAWIRNASGVLCDSGAPRSAV
jgi:hypothetical protein